MQDNIIKTGNLCHDYQTADNTSVQALKNINIEIKKGEFVAIIGTNGSGKSTLAKHFNTLLLPTSGTCIVCNLDCNKEENSLKIRQNVGMVFQNPDNQIVAAIVEEDVAFGPENIGMPPEKIRQRVDYALGVVKMLEYKNQAPHMLSGGQKQRIAIAGVLALEPTCMIFDEPTAMLDPVGRKEVLATVLELNKQKGITIIYITHFMQEAALADRVIVMDKGSIAMQGTPKEVFCQVDKIKQIGLDVPLAAQIAKNLNEKGLNLPAIINNKELAQALCQ